MKRFSTFLTSLVVAITLSAQNAKISPFLKQIVQEEQKSAASRRVAAESPSIKAFLKLTADADEQALAGRYGFTIDTRIGRVLIVTLPVSGIEALSNDPLVERIEAERMPRPMLDQVPHLIGADKVNANTGSTLPQAFTGKNAVVGIVDAGFDYINPMFDAKGSQRKAESAEPRIKWAADYMTQKKYTTTADILSAKCSSDAKTMYHGTHVAGIAAGSRINDTNDTFYQGIATEADIAMGAINSEITSAGLSSATAVQAFNDIFAYAKEQQKPCVINFSMGESMSFVNNRLLEEEAIQTLLSEPGRALVVSSGNSGSTSRLAHKPATMTEGGAGVWFNEDEQYGTYFGIEVKMKAEQTLTLRYTNSTYKDNKGEVSKTAQELSAASTLTLGNKTLTITAKGHTTDGYDVYYITAGMATFSTAERILVTLKGEGDAWVYADALCAQLENVPAGYVANHALAEEGYSMTWPAQMNEVVSVGNIAHRLKIITTSNKYASQGGAVTPTDLTAYESTKGEGYLAKSSSVGPVLIDNRVKPDVCAPGVNIVSAQNFFIDDDTYYALAGWDIGAMDTEYESWGNGVAGYFHIMAQTGTSMSAPAVTGTIALWLQADPTLTVERIKEVIAHSSRQPDATLTYPNQQYGYGEIDAFKGLCYLLGIDAIKEVSDHQPEQASFTLNGRHLTIRYTEASPLSSGHLATVRIYSTAGRLVAQYALDAVPTTLDLSSLPQGVYAVQLTTGQAATTGATLIRL